MTRPCFADPVVVQWLGDPCIQRKMSPDRVAYDPRILCSQIVEEVGRDRLETAGILRRRRDQLLEHRLLPATQLRPRFAGAHRANILRVPTSAPLVSMVSK